MEELIKDIHDLKFPPAYCLKDILSEDIPKMVLKPTYWGEWSLELIYITDRADAVNKTYSLIIEQYSI